jgi:hypothetical protein
LTEGVSTNAGSVYEVRVLVPKPGEAGLSWFVGTVVALLGLAGDPIVRARVEIVTGSSDEPLMSWTMLSNEAGPLKEKIDRDLAQMDAETFAAEWGLTSN